MSFQDRLKAVILLGSDWSRAEVAAALLLKDDTVRSHFKRYTEGGIAALERRHYVGSAALVTAAQLASLDAQLQQQLHPSPASLARWIEPRFGLRRTHTGVTALLHRLGYCYKKPKLLPRKAPAHQRCKKSTSLPTKGSGTTEAGIMPPCSWTPPTRSITRSSVPAASSPGAAFCLRATAGGGG